MADVWMGFQCQSNYSPLKVKQTFKSLDSSQCFRLFCTSWYLSHIMTTLKRGQLLDRNEFTCSKSHKDCENRRLELSTFTCAALQSLITHIAGCNVCWGSVKLRQSETLLGKAGEKGTMPGRNSKGPFLCQL